MWIEVVADEGYRRYCWTYFGWFAFRSSEELSKCLWGELGVWRREWSMVAKALALCTSEFDERDFSIHLYDGSRSRA